jgi:hypothetical protein
MAARRTYYDGETLRDAKTRLPVTHRKAATPGGGPQQPSVPNAAAGSSNVRPIRDALFDGPVEYVPLRKARHVVVPSLFERIADALDSPFGFGVFVGFVIGCFFTVGAAWVWSFYL